MRNLLCGCDNKASDTQIPQCERGQETKADINCPCEILSIGYNISINQGENNEKIKKKKKHNDNKTHR